MNYKKRGLPQAAALVGMMAVFGGAVLSGCGSGGGSSVTPVPTGEAVAQSTYDANLAKWRSVAPRKYSMEARLYNFYDTVVVKTTVADNQIVEQSVVHLNPAASVSNDDSFVSEVGTIERFFASAQVAITASADDGNETAPRITYDAQYGFPSDIGTTYAHPPSDDGGSAVTAFTPLP